jgi:hypothetical protein
LAEQVAFTVAPRESITGAQLHNNDTFCVGRIRLESWVSGQVPQKEKRAFRLSLGFRHLPSVNLAILYYHFLLPLSRKTFGNLAFPLPREGAEGEGSSPRDGAEPLHFAKGNTNLLKLDTWSP